MAEFRFPMVFSFLVSRLFDRTEMTSTIRREPFIVALLVQGQEGRYQRQ